MAHLCSKLLLTLYVLHMRCSCKLQLCDMVVTPECIAASDASTCVQQDMDAEYFANHPQQAAGQLSTAAKAGIGVAAGIAVAAVLAAAAVLVLRHRRLQAQKDKLPVHGKLDGADTGDVPSPEPKIFKHVDPKQDGPQGMKQVMVYGSNGSSLTSAMIGTCRNSNDTSMLDGSNITSLRSLNPAMSGSSLLQMMNKVPEILRGTMSKEEAASITLGELHCSVPHYLYLSSCCLSPAAAGHEALGCGKPAVDRPLKRLAVSTCKQDGV